MKQPNLRIRSMSFEKTGAIAGWLFILPWFIGFVFLFCKPFLQAIWFSFNAISFPDGGGIQYDFIGLKNYIAAFRDDPEFVRALWQSLGSIVSNVIIILIFSFFIAMLLNEKFAGRTLVRAIFFLPVIISSGVILQVMEGNTMASMLMSGSRTSILFEASSLQNVLTSIGLPQSISVSFMKVINGVFNLSWQSGIQILLFLAGLQTVPSQLYEAAAVEGSTKWENLWRITIPMVAPIILLNVVYTIINEFTSYSNVIMKLITDYKSNLNLGYGSTLALIYFLLIFIILSIVFAILQKRIYYSDR